MRFLGIDPGSRYTGYGVVAREGRSLVHLGSGRIVCGNRPFPDRLKLIHDGLNQVIEELTPTSAAIEGIFLSKNAMSALKLGHARGVAMLCCTLAGLPIEEFAPRVVKESLVGAGGATKAQVQRMVETQLKLAPGSLKEDAADALAIAITLSRGVTGLGSTPTRRGKRR